MNSNEWGIGYGVLHEKIAVQLYAQNIKLSLKLCDEYENDRHAINRLRLRQIITDGESDKAFKRLHKRIEKAVNKYFESDQK